MAKKDSKDNKKDSKKDNTLQIVGLILNIILLPGLGTLIGGGKQRTTHGILQLVFFVVGIIFCITIIGIIFGIPLMIAMWIWALIDGINMVQE